MERPFGPLGQTVMASELDERAETADPLAELEAATGVPPIRNSSNRTSSDIAEMVGAGVRR